MDFQPDEDDPDATAMAEAMGFSGFGSQRPAKRKFNANADAAVSSSGEKKGGNVSKTGANNAPLGVRRPLQLPPPSSGSDSLPARLSGVARNENGNAEDIDLGEDDDEDDDGDELNTIVLAAKNKFIDALQTPGGYQSEDADSMVAQPPTHTVVDNGPPGLPSRPPPQQRFQRDQNHPQSGRGRGDGFGAGSSGKTNSSWWEGYYDVKMNENPWEKLESERGLQPRGTWLARNAGHGAMVPEKPLAVADVVDGSAEAGAEYLPEQP